MPPEKSRPAKGRLPLILGAVAVVVIVIAVIAVLALTRGLGVGGGDASGGDTVADNAVAATINGVEIAERDVSERIELMRSANSELADATRWAEYLGSSGQTAESYRTSVIEDLITTELTRQAAEEAGVTVSAEEIDEQMEQIRASFTSEEQFTEMLARSGLSPESYRKLLELSLMQNKLQEKMLAEDPEANFFASLAERRESAEVVINAMPEGLPYDVEPIATP
jgi:parvulin-like peptidyl-prolyl isomerase